MFFVSDTLCWSCNVPEPMFAAFFWLGYINSCLNPFIYACTSKHFKRAFQRILCRKKWHKERARARAASCRNNSIWSKRTSTGNVFLNALQSSSHSSNDTNKSISYSNVHLNMLPSINLPTPEPNWIAVRASGAILRSVPNLNVVGKSDFANDLTSQTTIENKRRVHEVSACINENEATAASQDQLRTDARPLQTYFSNYSGYSKEYNRRNSAIDNRVMSGYGISSTNLNLRVRSGNIVSAQQPAAKQSLNMNMYYSQQFQARTITEHSFANMGRSAEDFSNIHFADSDEEIEETVKIEMMENPL